LASFITLISAVLFLLLITQTKQFGGVQRATIILGSVISLYLVDALIVQNQYEDAKKAGGITDSKTNFYASRFRAQRNFYMSLAAFILCVATFFVSSLVPVVDCCCCFNGCV